MLGRTWPAVQAYILGASESCFLKFAMHASATIFELITEDDFGE